MSHGRNSGMVALRYGRPTRAEAPSRPFTVRLSPAEVDRVTQAAEVNHQNASEFMRDAIVTAADECIERE